MAFILNAGHVRFFYSLPVGKLCVYLLYLDPRYSYVDIFAGVFCLPEMFTYLLYNTIYGCYFSNIQLIMENTGLSSNTVGCVVLL